MHMLWKSYTLGDMLLQYWKDEENRIGIQCFPVSLADKVVGKPVEIDSLIQVHFRGDTFLRGFANGHSLNNTVSTRGFILYDQQVVMGNQTRIVTSLRNKNNILLRHIVTYNHNDQAFIMESEIENASNNTIIVENLSSFSIGGLSPFEPDDAPGTLYLHRARSFWSAEGLWEETSIEKLGLEPSWSGSGIRLERFGQVGSMPVRSFFPFVSIEDKKNNVTWAGQIACPSSWQIEIRRQNTGLSLYGGLADSEYGHWWKSLLPGEILRSPYSIFTVGIGDAHQVSQRLLTCHKTEQDSPYQELPVIFNEYCTSWGRPNDGQIHELAKVLEGKGVDYFVIDCGWFDDEDTGWYESSGDWDISHKLFPRGLKAVADSIREYGMKPGIWFEFETCAPKSKMYFNTDLLLKRNGNVIDTEIRRFLDMRKDEVHKLLDNKVLKILNECGFEYIKVDYNETIGLGCDGCESLGEGLRMNMLATQEYFRKIRKDVEGIVIENCSSGGHRLEPSMMALCDMASFSDAHECVQIPIIAANLHRLIRPDQSQIWAVIHSSDSLRRIRYSIANTFLGVMCLSGDIDNLSKEAWKIIDDGIRFYKDASLIIKEGISSFYGTNPESYVHPQGWQAVIREGSDNNKLVVIHTFSGEHPLSIRLPIKPAKIHSVFCSDNVTIEWDNSELVVSGLVTFDSVSILLK